MKDDNIFQNEIRCIMRRSSGICDGSIECEDCEVFTTDEELISAYTRAINNIHTIESQYVEIRRLRILVDKLQTELECLAANSDLKAIEEFNIICKARTETMKEFDKRLAVECAKVFGTLPLQLLGEIRAKLRKEMVDEYIFTMNSDTE